MEAAVLAGFERQKQRARAARERAEAERTAAAEAARRAEEAAERERNDREATRMLKLGARPRRAGAASGLAQSPARSDRRRAAKGTRDGRDSGSTERGQRLKPAKSIAKKEKRLKPKHDPSKPLAGMEFVQRRFKTKPVVVPSTVDYSDVFPESLIGSETDALTKLRAATAAAAEANEQIYIEQAKRQEEIKRVAKLDKKDNGRRVSDITWVAVDAPAPLADRGIPGKSSSAGTSASPSRPFSKKEKEELMRKQRSEATAARAQALRNLINEANGRSPSASKKLERTPKPASPRHSQPKSGLSSRKPEKRQREPRDLVSPRRKKERLFPRREERRDYSDEEAYSEEEDVYSEDDSFIDDDEDEEDNFASGFEAIQAEERRSAKIAAREDMREKLRLEKAKKVKEHRRLQWERRNRGQ